MYSVSISMASFAYNKILVVPAGTNYETDFLDDGVVVDLVDLTTTTTTSTTTTITTVTVTSTSATMTHTSTVTTVTSMTATETTVTANWTDNTTDGGDGEGGAWVAATTKMQLAPVLLASLMLMLS